MRQTAALSVGKVRALQQLADDAGIFAMCAMDHRGSMQRMIDPSNPDGVDAATLTAYKQDLAAALAPVSSAVLLDPIFGAAQAVTSGALPARTGLIVSLEETGYEREAGGRVTTLLPGWSAEQIKRMGAQAVKILLYYHPEHSTAPRQRAVVEAVAAQARSADLPFILEPLVYPATEAEQDKAVYARRKPELIIRAARELSPLGVDVLKTEFPGAPGGDGGEGTLLSACRALDDATPAPWVLLSAGVDFETFARQVAIACRAGASGFLGGRAVWEEAFRFNDAGERRQWLRTVAAERMQRLHDIAREQGRPWWKKHASSPDSLLAVGADWYRSYAGFGGPR